MTTAFNYSMLRERHSSSFQVYKIFYVALSHLVEGVEVPLPLLLADHAGLLQQVVVDVAPDGVALEVEVDVHVLPEPGRVVVPVGLSIAECLENIIGGQEHFFHPLYLVLLRHICNLNMERHENVS